MTWLCVRVGVKEFNSHSFTPCLVVVNISRATRRFNYTLVSVSQIATSLERRAMACKIERVRAPGGFVVFRVNGRIDGAYVEVLQELIENEKTAKGRLALDLTEVTVVSLGAVRALTVAEANGIELRNCPAYVREWISRERERGLPA
jgi:hypothetical protein